MSSAYHSAIVKLVARNDLDAVEAEAVMGEIMEGKLEPALIASLLTALTMKGETAEELSGLARAMRSRALFVRAPEGAIDTCGTGGSGKAKINVSTLAAFVVAAEGVPVAKHGNRSNLGRCGSADVLEKIGAPIDLLPEEAEKLLAAEGIAFLFAPRFHSAMKHAAPVRRAIGFRTTFNFLGPLANPAQVRRQVLGVCDARRAPLMAEALVKLGIDRAWVLHGPGGLDEITLEAPTTVYAIAEGRVSAMTIDPRSLGFEAGAADHGSGTVEENARRFLEVLAGSAPRADLELVAVNAAAALVVSGRAPDLRSGLERSREILRSGAALRKLEAYSSAARAMVGARS
jgi:anthranilate phosphoribosyltransferase